LILLLVFQKIAFPFDENKLNFTITVNNLKTNLSIFSAFTLPGDTISLSFSGSTIDQFVPQYTHGHLLEDTRRSWRYIAPQIPGHYTLTILHNNPPEKFILNIFVMVPVSEVENERLNGYRIGTYPQKPFRGLDAYRAPEGFIEVTQRNKDVFVSPHFRLKQFLCKQQPGHWPKYMLLGPKILIKLELLLERINNSGIPASTVFIMSGYRTPWYNASIGNGRYSRHIYGDAVDTYIDENHDGEIDDLNKDDKASMADADVIYKIIDKLDSDPKYKHLLGGLGKYNKTAAHTWDVHFDTRGYRARW
jgi:hypothetical protein